MSRLCRIERRDRRDAVGHAVVVDESGVVSVRPVKVAERVGSQWIVASGLRAGERVVVEGTQRVKQGQIVRPIEYVAESSQQARS